ncbi:MAG TPA: hypothetical protein ENN66_07550 [Proteobacteria bacterium]|nr:hypothetical protein [Pseudomonadota bacterium]
MSELKISPATTAIVTAIILAIIPAAAPGLLRAAPSCHCFRQREYDPGNHFAADTYLLATSFNSLLARYFGVEKKELVLLKMKGGIDEDELLPDLRRFCPVPPRCRSADNGQTMTLVN